jgi:diphosphomevalonate decarboxylase
VDDAPRRLDICRDAILRRDFAALADIIELDSDMMHAVMQTSNPPLLYWQSATVEIFHAVREWRAAGLEVAYTVDAGPNVHVICPREVQKEAERRLREIPGISDVLVAGVGGAAKLVG